MNLTHIFTDPPILIVITTFISSIIFCITKYRYVNKNLKIFQAFLVNFKKSDLNFRFKEIDEWMCANPYVSSAWLEFKNTLIFSESVALKSEDDDLTYQEVSSTVQNIQTTVDPLYFFNEESLLTTKFNYKLLQTIPTILTGFGPLFTFLNIAIAFGKIDFSTQERTIASVAGLMSSMQIAALVSVIAVGSSLIFLIIEKILYQYEQFGHQRYMAQIDFGGLPFEKVMKNIEIIGKDILPAIKKYTRKWLKSTTPH